MGCATKVGVYRVSVQMCVCNSGVWVCVSVSV